MVRPSTILVLAAALLPVAARAAPDRAWRVADFDRVALSGVDSVRVVTGRRFGLVASGDAASLDRLDVRVEDGTLKIARRKPWLSLWGQDDDGPPVRLTVGVPSLSGASVSGSGTLLAGDAAAPEFDGDVAGSGRLLLLGLRADYVDLKLAGSGHILATGTATKARYVILGSGHVRARGIAARDLTVKIIGSGEVAARASGHALVKVIGSGSVFVRGTADCETKQVGAATIGCHP